MPSTPPWRVRNPGSRRHGVLENAIWRCQVRFKVQWFEGLVCGCEAEQEISGWQRQIQRVPNHGKAERSSCKAQEIKQKNLNLVQQCAN